MAETTKKPNLRIVGETTSAGGQFGTIRITGECKLLSDVECDKFACTGKTDVAGNMRAGEFRLTGECEVRGSLDAGRAGGRGELDVASRLRAEHVDFTGNLKVGEDCEAGDLLIDGGFQVNGLVSAERLVLKMYGPCVAREIGGGTITVKRSKASSLIHLFRSKSSGVLTTDSIEADVVDIQHTAAGVVRGNHVTIGAGCRVDRVEYAATINIHKNAVVKDIVRQS